MDVQLINETMWFKYVCVWMRALMYTCVFADYAKCFDNMRGELHTGAHRRRVVLRKPWCMRESPPANRVLSAKTTA